MRKLPNTTDTPPGGWKYTVPESGKTIGGYSGWRQLKDNLDTYYKSVGYEQPQDIYDKVEAQICDNNPSWCGDAPPDNFLVNAFRETKHTFHAAAQCLTTLVAHRAGSGERPTMEVQERRAKVCVACPMNQDTQACSVCNNKQLGGLIKKLVGAKETSVHSQLKYCAVCHCANAAKVATKHEAIWMFMPEKQKDALPDACWLKTEESEKNAAFIPIIK